MMRRIERWALVAVLLGGSAACGGDDVQEGLQGRWYAFSIGGDGTRQPDAHTMRVTADVGPDPLYVGAMELRADGTLVAGSSDVYAFEPDKWDSRLDSGTWSVSGSDGAEKLILQIFNDTGSFEFDLAADLLTVIDARGEAFRFERITDAPQLSRGAMVGARGYSPAFSQTPLVSVGGLPGDCPQCSRRDVDLAFVFRQDVVDVIRIHATSVDYPFRVDFDELVGVCAGSYPWRIDGSSVVLELSTGNLRLDLALGRSSNLVDAATGDLELEVLSPDFDPVVPVCSQVGPPPAGADPLRPDTWG